MSGQANIDSVIQNGTNFKLTLSDSIEGSTILQQDDKANSVLTAQVYPMQARSSYTNYKVFLEVSIPNSTGAWWTVLKEFDGADHDDSGGFTYTFQSSVRVKYRFRLEDAATDTTLRRFHVLLTG